MFGSETLDDSVRRLWWLYLVTGILWSLWGLMILSLRPSSIASVAILAGVSFILGGIGQFFLARRVEEWRWLFYVGGVLAILAGIMTFVWPGKTLLVLAVFVSWYLVVSGIFTVVGAFVGPKYSGWWLGIILGVVEFLLGAWAIASPTRQLLLLINLVGFYMLFYGISEIFAGFALRSRRDDRSVAAA